VTDGACSQIKFVGRPAEAFVTGSSLEDPQ